MKLYGICLVKNEGDIIEQCLTHALKFCDRIFVIDNGSSDRTWETVQSLAQKHDQIVPEAQILEPFREGIRAIPYNKYNKELTAQDWWMRLDGDEFLYTDPRPIMADANNAKADFIKAWQAQFYYTDIDHQTWLAGKDNPQQSIFERRRYYRVDWREYRLFRNQPNVFWDETISKNWPTGLTQVHQQLIFNRHYQYRDPEQIKKRLAQRYALPDFDHITSTNWEKEIRSANTLEYYQPDQPLKVNIPWFYAQRTLIEIKFKLQKLPFLSKKPTP